MAYLNYRHLGYFRAVAREGNLTRAAERMNLSQSALSVQIKRLEEALGQDLFERRGRQLLLTEAGRIALDYSDTIFGAGEELLGVLARGDGAQRQVLRVGAVTTLSRNFQIGYLRPLLGREDVELILRSGTLRELLAQVEALALDLVLTNQPPPRDAATPWVARVIREQSVSIVGPPGLAPLTMPRGLDGRPILVPSLASDIRAGFDAMLDAAGVHPVIAGEVDDMAMLRLMAREAGTLALVPPVVVQDELEAGRLVEYAALPGLVETFYAITLPRRFPNPLLRLLLSETEGDGPGRDA